MDDACPIGGNDLELKVEKEELNINCTILPKGRAIAWRERKPKKPKFAILGWF